MSIQQVMLATVAPASGASDLLTGIVSYWNMDEASGNRADSVGSNTLVDNNTVTSASGVISNAASFASASSEFLNVTDNASISFSTSFSVSAWIRQDTTVALNRCFFSKWNTSTGTASEFICRTLGSGSEIRVFIANASNDGGANAGDTTDASMVADTFYHLGVVYDGSLTGNSNRLKIYLNGTQKTLSFTGTIAASLPSTSADLWFGAESTSAGRPLNGKLDEVGLWNIALTSGQITRLYNGGAGCAYPFSGCP